RIEGFIGVTIRDVPLLQEHVVWTEVQRIGAGNQRRVAADVFRPSEAVSPGRIEVPAVMCRVKVRYLRAVERTAVRAKEDSATFSVDDRSELGCEVSDPANALDPFVRCPWRSCHPPEKLSWRHPGKVAQRSVVTHRSDECARPTVAPLARSIRRPGEQHAFVRADVPMAGRAFR